MKQFLPQVPTPSLLTYSGGKLYFFYLKIFHEFYFDYVFPPPLGPSHISTFPSSCYLSVSKINQNKRTIRQKKYKITAKTCTHTQIEKTNMAIVFMFATYSWVCGLPWSVVDIPVPPLETSHFLFPVVSTVKSFLSTGETLCPFPLLCAGIVSDLSYASPVRAVHQVGSYVLSVLLCLKPVSLGPATTSASYSTWSPEP